MLAGIKQCGAWTLRQSWEDVAENDDLRYFINPFWSVKDVTFQQRFFTSLKQGQNNRREGVKRLVLLLYILFFADVKAT